MNDNKKGVNVAAMEELCYCQYAFVTPACRAIEIGPGVDPEFNVELVDDNGVAALVSRVSLERFSPDKLEGKTPEDIQWLGGVASRHNAIIVEASNSSPVLPLRLGTLFRSLDSLRAALSRCRRPVAEFFSQVGDRREWGVKIYFDEHRAKPTAASVGPTPPHTGAPSGTAYLTQRKHAIEARREQRADIYKVVQTLERRLAGEAEQSLRVRNLPSDLTGRSEEMVFNGAFLLSPDAQPHWRDALENVHREIEGRGLLLEVSGPWPPYHFCPNLAL
jgi:hypothetical protein